VLLKGQSCLLKFHASLGQDSLKLLVLIFRRCADFSVQLLHALGERKCGRIVFSRPPSFLFTGQSSLPAALPHAPNRPFECKHNSDSPGIRSRLTGSGFVFLLVAGCMFAGAIYYMRHRVKRMINLMRRPSGISPSAGTETEGDENHP
jgi:hypothetical protein